MADNNTLNFDLDAPATPTLTLDPAEDLAAPQPQKRWLRTRRLCA